MFPSETPTCRPGWVLAHDDFVIFYQAIDLLPEIGTAQVPAAKQALAALAQKIPDNPDLQRILAFTDPAYPRDAESS